MVCSVQKIPSYFLMNLVVFFVDHLAHQYMVNKPDISGRVRRWVLLLEELDCIVEYKPNYLHKQVNHLSRMFEKGAIMDSDDELPDDY